MQIEQSTLKATPSGICTVEDGVIYEVNALYGTKTRVGVTDGKYKELKELADNYYNKLVELGAIVPPKTPEQIQQETMQVMQGMLKQMQTLQQELEVLKNERSNASTDVKSKSDEHSEANTSVGASTASVGRSKQPAKRTKSD